VIKRIIRNLYWRYGHKGDPWQARLVIYHLGNLIDGDLVHPTAADIVLGQLNSQTIKIDKVANIRLEGLKSEGDR
jgi:hypothetical protein